MQKISQKCNQRPSPDVYAYVSLRKCPGREPNSIPGRKNPASTPGARRLPKAQAGENIEDAWLRLHRNMRRDAPATRMTATAGMSFHRPGRPRRRPNLREGQTRKIRASLRSRIMPMTRIRGNAECGTPVVRGFPGASSPAPDWLKAFTRTHPGTLNAYPTRAFRGLAGPGSTGPARRAKRDGTVRL